MHEYWLQKYIKLHFVQMGFTRLNGPYPVGPDFKGVLGGKTVRIEAEWGYGDYIKHRHGRDFADVMVVAAGGPAPAHLKDGLPPTIINLERERVEEWAEPLMAEKKLIDYRSFQWRKLARNLLYLYAFYSRKNGLETTFTGSRLLSALKLKQTPVGFKFGEGGRENGFEGTVEDKADWDYWLEIAHTTADRFKLKPALLRPTWVDRIALWVNHTGRITDSEANRFQEVAVFIDSLVKEGSGGISENDDRKLSEGVVNLIPPANSERTLQERSVTIEDNQARAGENNRKIF